MIQAEYVRSLNCNYERILLEKKPEEKRYQYCILCRGGIKGLLPCGLRYINGAAYLYYDISSKQNIAQMYSTRNISRQWVQDFLWSIKQMQQELERFLLDFGNVLMFPDQIYQDLESKVFYFLYIPYCQEEGGFNKMMEFLVEHIDYEDELLVECIYYMYEQLERNGAVYLREKIFEDVARLEEDTSMHTQKLLAEQEIASEVKQVGANQEVAYFEKAVAMQEEACPEVAETDAKESRKGLLGIFEGKRHRNKRMREEYQSSLRQEMLGYAVAEETNYEGDEYGRTMYMEEKEIQQESFHRLYTVDGKLLATLEKKDLTIGKKKEEVDLPLEDASVSRLHARIVSEMGLTYLEDLNSTNGTYKNGLRLQPYEKRKLDAGDEIKCGKVSMMFR